MTILAACVGSALIGCGGGGDPASNTTPTTIPITGTVSAPSGTLAALSPPSGLDRLIAAIFGNSAMAALSGTIGVSGTTVRLIEINSSGVQVGAELASATTTTDGSFTVDAPATFTPAAKYVLRVGSGAAQMDTMVTDTTSQDIDPGTQAATDLILSTLGASGSLASLNVAQIADVQDTVAKLANDVTPGSTVADIVTALKAETQNEEEANNILTSIAADGTISGIVKDSSNTPLANIDIVVSDFSNWVTRARTRTNAAGQYTVRVASGRNYIVGAINYTLASTAASEWWTAGGGVSNQFSGDKIIVADATAVTKDFTLDAGARITGVVYATDGTTTLGGIEIRIRDFSNDMPVAFARTRANGLYRVNVRPGTYTVGTRNRTLQPYASIVYNGPAIGSTTTSATGGVGAAHATPIVVAAGDSITAKFALPVGVKISGVVTDPSTTPAMPVAGIAVRFYGNNADDTAGEFVEGFRTHRNGGYRMWVVPGNYTVNARGQSADIIATVDTPVVQSFTSLVGQATATLTSDGTPPVSQTKVRVFDSTGATYQGFEATNGDGAVTVYTNATGNYLLEYKVDNGSTTIGSAIHNGTATPTGTRLTTGTGVAFTADSATVTALGTLTLPTGGELTGTVTKGGKVGSYKAMSLCRYAVVAPLAHFVSSQLAPSKMAVTQSACQPILTAACVPTFPLPSVRVMRRQAEPALPRLIVLG